MTTPIKTKRQYCSKCHYPQKTCLCAWVSPIDSPVNIVVLQHPKEVKHAKNSVKLLHLGLKAVNVLVGESPGDWAELIESAIQAPEKFSVCYPDEQSTPLESLDSDAQKQQSFPTGHTVIFIDASWRKALKIWLLNPWLHNLQTWHFSAPPANKYQIRHTTQENSLSTLESVAYVLEFTKNIDCTALYVLFEKMQEICFIKGHKSKG
ncbi:tRNA-uridine aminocarboxypropyltransferase [Paraglaciecola sp. 2405UD69-4]|uniref:tRNA-uridine aminocarboxypropyltransferase n=1 Tax=Paraglaciecola sp. 2405UD69-4 TaxID=3391836 RepID=UPI0039C8D2E3